MHKGLMIVLLVVLFGCWAQSQEHSGGRMDTKTTSNTRDKTGIVITTTQQAIQQHINSLLNNSQCFTFSSHHGIISLSPFGQVYFKIDHIKLLEKIGGDVEVRVVDGVGLKVVISNMKVRASANWLYKYKKFFLNAEDLGRGILEAVGLKMEVVIKVEMGPEGSVSLKAAHCEGSFEDLKFRVGEGFRAFLYSPITSLVSFVMKNPCRMLGMALDLVQTTPLYFPLLDMLHVNISLTQPPLFNNGSIRVSLRGEFSAINATKKFIFRPRPLLEGLSSRLINMQVSMASLYSVLRSLVTKAPLKTTLSADDFEGPLKDQFKASCWSPTCLGFPFVQLKVGYSGYYISVEVELSKTPQIAVRPDGIVVRVNDLSVTLNATKNGTTFPLATFYLTSTFLAQLQLSPAGRFHWSIEKKDYRIVRTESHIGMVPSGMLEFVTESTFESIALPKLNDMGKVGWRIPLPSCLSFINSDLTLKLAGITVQSDLKIGL